VTDFEFTLIVASYFSLEIVMAKVDIAAETQALPLGYYLSGPLTAAIEAQALSANSTVEFIDAVGTDDQGKLRTMEFKYDQTVTDPVSGAVSTKEVTLTVPTLALTEGPHIAIEDLTVSFEFKIRDVISKENQSKLTSAAGASYQTSTKMKAATGGLAKFLYGDGSVEASAKFKTNFNVSATYQSTSRQETDRSATLKMTMTARQRVPEGFQRVLTIFADSITAQVTLP
jgi:hypothetical protein